MYTALNIKSNLRFERKFLVESTHRSEVLHYIKRHPAFFREIYHPRQINNIYLDTDQMQFFDDNKVGVSNRKKIRIRWYGETFGPIKNPKLEYKIKEDLMGDKWTFNLNDFEVKPGFSSLKLKEILKASNLPEPIAEDLKSVRPSLLNSYHRTYFLSADKKFRITLDDQLSYYRFDYPISLFKAKYSNNQDLILELKYQPEDDDKANKISNHWPYRLSKSSKYVNGIDLTRMRGRD